jgi:hypothetical protein
MPNATLRASGIGLGTRTARHIVGTVVLDSTVEVGAGATAGTLYTFARVPTSARINGLSRYAHDDLASSGAPTIDFGFAPVDANFTADDDCLNDGIDVATAAGTGNLFKDIANHGKLVWEIIGLSADPGGLADLTGVIRDAATNTGGTVTLNLVYTMD